MKRILLIVAAALVMTASQAQQLTTATAAPSKKTAVQAPGRQLPTLAQRQAPAPMRVDDSFMVPQKRPATKSSKIVNLPQLSPSKAGLAPIAQAPQLSKNIAKAGSVQTTYYGYGTSWSTNEQEDWTVYDGYDTEGNPYLINLIPTIFSDSNMGAPYTISGSTVTVEPYCVSPYVDPDNGYYYYLWLCSLTSSDGSIVLTLGDDGSLTTIDDECIGVFAFPYGTETFDTTWSTCYGYWSAYDDVNYVLSADDIPVAPANINIAAESIYPMVSLSYTGYSYYNHFAIVPPYAPTNFVNYTTGAESYAWSVTPYSYDDEFGYYEGEAVTSTDEDFSFTADPNYVYYGPVTLTATNSAGVDRTYSYGLGIYWYADADLYAYPYMLSGQFDFDDDSSPLIGMYDLDRYNDIYGSLATPDVNTQSYTLSSLIFYQGKPTAPLYLEGINMLVYGFVDNGSANATCQIYKVTRDDSGSQTLGDLIAESSTMTYTSGSTYTDLTWSDFYIYDEDGMTEGIDYLFIEDEFTIVISDWDNGTFTAYPIAEYYQPSNGLSTVGCIMDGEQYDFSSMYGHVAVGYVNYAASYLYTEDELNYEAPAEGGSYTVHVEPMYCGYDEDGNYTTYLYMDAFTELPDWVTVEISDESYTDDAWYFDLTITVDAIDSSTDGRAGVVSVFQPGARLDITVSQGTATGIDNVQTTATKGSYGGKAYNLAGQRVSTDTKGVVLRDGRKVLNK